MENANGLRNSYYDEDNQIEYNWYESSNIVYSECRHHKNLRELMMVFKSGAVYTYPEVTTRDYLKLKKCVKEGSAGKSFNEFIKKGGYDYKKLGEVDLDEIDKREDDYLRAKKENVKPNIESIISIVD